MFKRKQYGPVFFVYAYCDITKPGRFSYNGCPLSFLFEPFWIGKGKDTRHTDIYPSHRSKWFMRKIGKLKACGMAAKDLVFIVRDGLMESEAFATETSLITPIGRRFNKTGPLINITLGGEGMAGVPMSDKCLAAHHARKGKFKVANPIRGEAHYMYGKKLSDERRREMSESRFLNPPRVSDWVVTFPNGATEKITNLLRFCRAHGLNHSRMARIGGGIGNLHKGFACLRVSDKKGGGVPGRRPRVEMGSTQRQIYDCCLDGLRTSSEIAASTGWSLSRVSSFLGALVRRGSLEKARGNIAPTNGRKKSTGFTYYPTQAKS